MQKRFGFAVTFAMLAASAAAQIEPALDQIRSGDLMRARATLSEIVQKEPSNTAAWHAFGIVLVAIGDAPAAEEAFAKEVELAKGVKPEESDLEALLVPGSGLAQGLRLQKTAIQLQGGEASALNNLGAAEILLGKMDEATEHIDRASMLDPNSGHAWLNGALIALADDDAALAEKDVRAAIGLGQKNALAQAILAEALLKLGRLERAEDAYKEAFRFDPTHPYALLVKSKVDTAQGRLRESQRAFVQALTAGPAVAVDSKLIPRFGEGLALGGNASDAHATALDHRFSSTAGATRLQGFFDQQLVENRSNGKQRTSQVEFTHSGRIGTVHANHVNWGGGRPGSVDSLADLDPSPGNRFRFTQTSAFLLAPIQSSASSKVWLHANYRTAKNRVKSPSDPDWLESLRDVEWMEEVRWDLSLSRRSLLQIGATYANLKRGGTGPRPIQPSEQVLGNGLTHMWTAYAVNRRPITSIGELTLGVMAGGAAGNQQIQPLVSAGFRAPGGRIVNFRVTPRFNDSISNLIPVDTVAENPQANPLDRNQFSTSDFNRNPTLQGSRSKLLDFELELTSGASPIFKSETVLFHRTLNDVNSQGADSRLTTTLVLTPVRDAEATGIEHRITKVLSDPFTLRMLFRYQETEADFTNTTYDLGQYPSLVEKEGNEMPNFPRYQAVASLDYADGPWTASLIGVYFGERTTAITRTISGEPRTFLTKAKAGGNAHLAVRRKLNRQANALLDVFNIGNANFYPGYPGKTTFVLGLNYRF